MRKRTIRLTLLFSAAVFFLILNTMFFSLVLMIAAFRLGLVQYPRLDLILLGYVVSSVLIGMALALSIGNRALAPILEISAAAGEVAKGNFNVKLKRRSRVAEIEELAKNFELMVQELTSIETFRSDFISNVSHEFKTPLTAIEGYATLLQDPGISPERREVCVSKILYNTKRLGQLTGNILQLSRLENQEIVPKRQTFSLDEQLRQVILLFEDAWTRKELELDVDLETIDYSGSADLLGQVWQNLIGNAVKFTGDGGCIHVRLRRDDGCVRVYIVDDGIGMDEETQKRIFEKFYQGDRSHSSEGNGLGLTLAKRIIDLHHGTITVWSRPGQGTTFVVTLPWDAG